MNIKLKELVKPISKDNPVGLNLREDVSPQSLYYHIKDARTRARNIERKIQLGDQDLDAKADWEIVYNDAIEILTKHSKDIEVCAWFLETLVRRHGFDGLNMGFQLINQLLDKYWKTIYPLLDEDGFEARLAPLVGLNGEDSEGCLIQPISNVFITEGDSIGPFSLWEYQQSLEIEKITDPKLLEKKREQDAVMPEAIKQAVFESSSKFYQYLNDSLLESINSFELLTQMLEKKCEKNAPPSSSIKRTLENFQDHVRFILKDSPFAVSTNKEVVSNEIESSITNKDSEIPVHSIVSSNIDSREAALISLVKIADFFKKTEPHSPIPYLLDRAVRWGSLPFPELLREMINDEGARKSVYEMSGIRKD